MEKGNGNLRVPTSEEAREIGRKGGVASAEARKRKKQLREIIDILLEKEITSKDGVSMSGAEAIVAKQFEKALKGDTKAFEMIRDTAGQKPVQQVEVNTISPETLLKVEEMVNNATTGHNQ